MCPTFLPYRTRGDFHIGSGKVWTVTFYWWISRLIGFYVYFLQIKLHCQTCILQQWKTGAWSRTRREACFMRKECPHCCTRKQLLLWLHTSWHIRLEGKMFDSVTAAIKAKTLWGQILWPGDTKSFRYNSKFAQAAQPLIVIIFLTVVWKSGDDEVVEWSLAEWRVRYLHVVLCSEQRGAFL